MSTEYHKSWIGLPAKQQAQNAMNHYNSTGEFLHALNDAYYSFYLDEVEYDEIIEEYNKLVRQL